MAHAEQADRLNYVRLLDFGAFSGAALVPTVQLSGAVYVSGGALWYTGYGGTNTEVAAS